MQRRSKNAFKTARESAIVESVGQECRQKLTERSNEQKKIRPKCHSCKCGHYGSSRHLGKIELLPNLGRIRKNSSSSKQVVGHKHWWVLQV